MDRIVSAAAFSSLSDETPEGRSIVTLAARLGRPDGGDGQRDGMTFVPFSATTRIVFSVRLAMARTAGKAGPLNPSAHGFSEILYSFSSQFGNNGSAFAGLSGNTVYYNSMGAAAMWIGRYSPTASRSCAGWA